MKISQENFIIAWNNHKLIKGALKWAHVRRNYIYYDDLYQNAVILYAQMLEDNSGMDRKKLDRLAFQKIVWATLNSLHKVQVRCERTTEVKEAEKLTEEHNYADWLILIDEFGQMREIERQILIDHIIFKRNLKEIAEAKNVHRGSLQRVKRKLLSRLRKKYLG